MRKAILTAALPLALLGCEGSEQCPVFFKNGEIIEHRITGERFVVTRAKPFNNIYSGECSIAVDGPAGRGSVSSYAFRERQP
jgi:hypothetical protein